MMYRYNAVKGRLAILQARLSDVNSLLKHKNPSLLLQVPQTSRRHLLNRTSQTWPF